MERQETARQRDIRLRREARERERERKRLEKEAKAQRKANLRIAIARFKIINGVNTNYISRIKKWYERRGEILTSQEVEDKLLNEYMPPPPEPEPALIIEDEGRKDMHRLKDESGKFRKLGMRVFTISNMDLAFMYVNLPYILDIITELHDVVPNGFSFGIALYGTHIKVEEGREVRGEYRCFLVSKHTDEIEEAKDEIAGSRLLDLPSDQWYELNKIEIHFEENQGGGVHNKVKIELGDLKLKYHIYNPTTKKLCGQMCLEQLGIKTDIKTKMSETDIRAISSIPVYTDINQAKECKKFILLREGHYIICTDKTTLIYTKETRKKIVRKATELKLKQDTEEYKIKQKERMEKVKATQSKQIERFKRVLNEAGGEAKLERERKRKLIYKRTTDYLLKRELKAHKNHILKDVWIFDIESKRQEYDRLKCNKIHHITEQIPVIIGVARRELEEDIKFNYYEGNECIERFITALKNSDCTHLIGFNSGKYDYILIKNEIIKQGGSITEYLKGATALMRGEIKFKIENKLSRELSELPFYEEGEEEYKTIHLIDLMNYTTGSLKNNLLEYECETSKGELEYKKISDWGSMEEAFKIEIIEYLEKDCRGTYELYEKLNEPYFNRGLDLLNCFTASQASMKILKHYWTIDDHEKGKLSRTRKTEDLNMFRRSANGGRCEVFKREYKSILYDLIQNRAITYDEINEYMRAFDVNSLYPTAMRNNLYPVGEHIYTRKYVEGKLGIYECKIKKPNNILHPLIFDRQYKSYNLLECTERQIYNSVDIEQMRKYGYEVKIYWGHYWEESEYIFKNYVDEFYKVKKNSKKGSPQYENAKLMLNAPYGKMLQGDKHKCNFIVSTKEELESIKKKMSEKVGEWRANANCDNGTFNYTFYEDAGIYSKRTPHLGSFILSYSKIPVYERMIECEPSYTDTDSIYCDAKFSHLFNIGGELGQWSDDVKGKIIYGSFMAKKLKYVELVEPNYIWELDENGEPKLDKKGKKIAQKDENGKDRYINDNNYTFTTKKTGKGCDPEKLTKIDFANMRDGKSIENIRDFRMIRDLKNGIMEYWENERKIIKMNDSNRYFNNNSNDSLPLGHIDINIEREEIKI